MATALRVKRAGDQLLPLNEAAKRIGRSHQFLRRLLAARQLAFVQTGQKARIFIWESDLLAWLERSTRPALREAR